MQAHINADVATDRHKSKISSAVNVDKYSILARDLSAIREKRT